ncbi:MAG: AmmeMemoRadiSam system radical SAM enzyme [Bacteroidales bacterium]|jgi:pyruvate formate lyase activating enzyme|nr:AmmeMemoRadiSam system radical SAM enzyme [Bacteroidales bacterium]
MKEALFYNRLQDQKVQCLLCPHNCVLAEGKEGKCLIRKNINGLLIASAFAQITAVQIDPIEKKPLNHFYPGSKIFSIGFAGCNLHCRYCQNWHISQHGHPAGTKSLDSSGVVQAALKSASRSIAYTYNEPLTNFEFVFETAIMAHNAGLKNVVVSNGFINPLPLDNILPYIDAFNIDLKSFSEDFYKPITGGSLAPVLNSLKTIRQSGKHLEVTFLLIPGLNDDEQLFIKMLKWLKTELGQNTILHISAYYPAYKSEIEATSTRLLLRFAKIAREHLSWVYTGNSLDRTFQDSICPKCGSVLIFREGYTVQIENLENSVCRKCGEVLPFVNEK